VIQIGPGDYLDQPAWILASDVDRWLGYIALLEPDETRPSWRRKALHHIVVPMRVAAAVYPQEREEARIAAQALLERLVAGEPLPPDAPALEEIHGHGKEIGLERWCVASELRDSGWSEVFEIIGGYCILRIVDAPPREEWLADTRISIEHLTLPYLPAEGAKELIEGARRQLGLAVVDPEWEWILPKHYIYE